MPWLGQFRDGRAHRAGGSLVPSGTDVAAVSFRIVTDISRLAAQPGYATAAMAPVWLLMLPGQAPSRTST